MMAMYKLYVIVHRRADFPRIYREITDVVYGKFYGEKRQQAKNAVMQLAIVSNIAHGIGGYSY